MISVVVVANVTSEIETKEIGTNKVANFSIAHTQGKDQTVYYNIIAWNELANICAQYLGKGKKVAINGTLYTSAYEKDGIKHKTVSILANKIELLSPKEKGNAEKKEKAQEPKQVEIDEGDIPF